MRIGYRNYNNHGLQSRVRQDCPPSVTPAQRGAEHARKPVAVRPRSETQSGGV